MQIEGREIDEDNNYLDSVTYVPNHAQGNANHKDCQIGVIIRITHETVFVLYCNTRTVQATDPSDLVWG